MKKFREVHLLSQMKKFRGSWLLILLVVQVACLKTRGQIREERDSEGARAEATRVPALEEVRPKNDYVIDEIKEEITRLNGRIEDLERANKGPDKGAEGEERKKIDQRLSQLEQTTAQILESITQLQEIGDPPTLLKKANKFFEDKDYTAAVNTLGQYIKIPKVAKLDEALFLRGESQYKLKQYKKAIIDYSKISEKFPSSKRAPAALYKTGLSFDALGLKDEAKGFYQELVEKYPKSSESKKVMKKSR